MLLKKLFIDHRIADAKETLSIRTRLNLPTVVVERPKDVYDAVSSTDDPIATGKTVLFLTANQGAFVKKCPGTRCYTCCGYQILHIGTYCTMDCAYCILQSYFHPPVLQFFVNHREMFTELDALFRQEKIFRIGTGEFTDSLIWEDWTDLTPALISKFSRQNRAVLELKTKTTAVSRLKDLDHNRKTIIAWSLNTDTVIGEQERRTSSLSERLEAAALCESWGYPIAFHFDPMIIYDGCEQAYQQVIDRIFSYVSAKNVIWISIGSFRFMPDLKTVIQKRFRLSKIIYGEFVPGLDGKMRYFKPLRLALYRKIISRIRQAAPGVFIYFCMEDEEVWQKCLGFVPGKRGGLPGLLDEEAKRVCSLEL
jgi:DNA repair photolyase